MKFVLTLLCLWIAPCLVSAHTPQTCEEYVLSPDFSGRTVIDTGMQMTLWASDDDHPTPTRISFLTRAVGELPKDLRALVKRLRTSTKSMTENEHEVGALIARYGDGTNRGIRFTSRTFAMITGEDMIKGVNQSGIFRYDRIQPTAKAIHLHTHPNLDNPLLGDVTTMVIPSIDDFDWWLAFRDQLQDAEPGIEFEAIVVPTSPALSGMVFIVNDDHLNDYARFKSSP